MGARMLFVAIAGVVGVREVRASASGGHPEEWREAPAGAEGPPRILILGDSWAEFSEDYLETDCAGSTADNRGIGGTEAAEWGASFEDLAGRALDPSEYSHVWASIGGNDMLNVDCEEEGWASVPGALTAGFDTIEAATPSLPKLVLGYAISADEGRCKPKDVARLNELLRAEAGSRALWTYVDTLDEGFGLPAEAYAPSRYFDDPIHPNRRGYEIIFSIPQVQAYFGCGSPGDDEGVSAPESAPGEGEELPLLPSESDASGKRALALAAAVAILAGLLS